MVQCDKALALDAAFGSVCVDSLRPWGLVLFDACGYRPPAKVLMYIAPVGW